MEQGRHIIHRAVPRQKSALSLIFGKAPAATSDVLESH